MNSAVSCRKGLTEALSGRGGAAAGAGGPGPLRARACVADSAAIPAVAGGGFQVAPLGLGCGTF